MNRPLDRLRHHVSGAIARGEAEAIVAVEAPEIAAWIQHGKAGEPMRTERTQARRNPSTLADPRKGPIRSYWEVRVNGRWLRVWVGYGYGDPQGPFIRINGARCAVTIQEPTR